MFADRVSEAIAHFIGLFETTLEQARLRKAYDEFKAQQAPEKEFEEIPNQSVNIKVGYVFNDFDPGVPYLPVEPQLVPHQYVSPVHFQPPEIPSSEYAGVGHPGTSPAELISWSTGSSRIVQFELDPPGSVAMYINQELYMADDDYVGVGGHHLAFNPAVADVGLLIDLVETAKTLSPLSDVPPPGSSEDIVAFITETTVSLNAYTEDGHGDAEVFVVKGEAVEGQFVNGAPVEKMPVLDDFLPPEEATVEESKGVTSVSMGGRHGDDLTSDDVNSARPTETLGNGEIVIDVSVELEAGGNTLVNTAGLTNNWTGGGVFAVTKDHVELNAVVQVNAYSDVDQVTSAIGSWELAASDPTQAFNIAMFERIDPVAEKSAPVGDFPEAWGVTRIDGDLIIMNWIEQYSFMTDSDIAILSSSGVTTTVTTGDNTAVNQINVSELSYFYDLVIVGGSLYDANVIFQMNVLLDNDLIGAVEGFETTGQGSASTTGNLLWNQAGIVNYSASDNFSALPEHYREAAESLMNGSDDLSAEILKDPAFAGLAGLRVLYVSGDFINLQYIKQVNVLGDSDQVALAMNAAQAHPEADWVLSTGSNNLINLASIVDVDGNDKTYVGGEIYSDEILIQAEFVSSAPDLGAQNPDVLVNEAVAFLDDDLIGSDDDGSPATPAPIDTASADPMHNMLA